MSLNGRLNRNDLTTSCVSYCYCVRFVAFFAFLFLEGRTRRLNVGLISSVSGLLKVVLRIRIVRLCCRRPALVLIRSRVVVRGVSSLGVVSERLLLMVATSFLGVLRGVECEEARVGRRFQRLGRFRRQLRRFRVNVRITLIRVARLSVVNYGSVRSLGSNAVLGSHLLAVLGLGRVLRSLLRVRSLRVRDPSKSILMVIVSMKVLYR